MNPMSIAVKPAQQKITIFYWTIWARGRMQCITGLWIWAGELAGIWSRVAGGRHGYGRDAIVQRIESRPRFRRQSSAVSLSYTVSIGPRSCSVCLVKIELVVEKNQWAKHNDVICLVCLLDLPMCSFSLFVIPLEYCANCLGISVFGKLGADDRLAASMLCILNHQELNKRRNTWLTFPYLIVWMCRSCKNFQPPLTAPEQSYLFMNIFFSNLTLAATTASCLFRWSIVLVRLHDSLPIIVAIVNQWSIHSDLELPHITEKKSSATTES